jgi:hypothetical protein
VDIAAGELPAETDASALAQYVGAVIQGMSQQARDGADRATLTDIAALAMRAWPETAEAGERAEAAGETHGDPAAGGGAPLRPRRATLPHPAP